MPHRITLEEARSVLAAYPMALQRRQGAAVAYVRARAEVLAGMGGRPLGYAARGGQSDPREGPEQVTDDRPLLTWRRSRRLQAACREEAIVQGARVTRSVAAKRGTGVKRFFGRPSSGCWALGRGPLAPHRGRRSPAGGDGGSLGGLPSAAKADADERDLDVLRAQSAPG